MHVAIYCRCSTDVQEESIGAQLEACRHYCEQHDHTIIAEYIDEGVSGGLECVKRPGARQMLNDARQKQFEGIVARSSRRLGRDTIDLLILRKEAKRLKLTLLFTSQHFGDDAQGDLLFSVVASVGEFERKHTGEVIRDHNRGLARIGRWPSGRPPLGYLYNKSTKTLSVDPDRAADAVTLFEAFAATGGNRSETARRLNASGILTRDGNLWTDDAIRWIITNRLYRGIIAYDGVECEIAIERIIPEGLLTHVDNLIESTKFVRVRRADRRVFPYSGILRCAHCGNAFKGNVGNRTNSYTYVCRGKKEKGVCRARGLGCQRLDRLIGQGIEEALTSELESLRRVAQDIDQTTEQPRTDVQANRRRTLKESRERLIDLYTSGIITDKADLQARLEIIDAQLTDVTAPKPARLTADQIVSMLEEWSATWGAMPDADKRQVLLTLCPRIYASESDEQGTVLVMETTLSAGNVEVSERA